MDRYVRPEVGRCSRQTCLIHADRAREDAADYWRLSRHLAHRDREASLRYAAIAQGREADARRWRDLAESAP